MTRQTHPNTAIDFNRMFTKFNKFDTLSNFLENPPLSPSSSLGSLDQVFSHLPLSDEYKMFTPYYTLRVVIETGDRIYEESVISDPTTVSVLAKKFSVNYFLFVEISKKKIKKVNQGKSVLGRGSPLTTPKNSLRRSKTPLPYPNYIN